MPTAAPEHSAIHLADLPRYRRLFPLALVLGVTLLVFLPLVRFGFVRWDDYDTIVHNPRMAVTAASLRLIWTHSYMGLYVPLTSTLWWIAAAMSRQPNPHLFHALNLLIHLGSSAIVFLFLERLLRNRWAAAAGAMLFAVHPVQVESVAWISGTKDLLCGLLVMIALWQWLLFAEGGYERRGHYTIATLCFLLALFAKPTAIVCPFLALALAWLVCRLPLARTTRWLSVWFLLIIPCAVWTSRIQVPRYVQAPALVQRPVIAADAIAFYIHKIAVPLGLGVDYGRTPQRVLEHWHAYGSLILVMGLFVSLWLMRRRTIRLAALLFLIPLLPVLGIVPFDFQYISTVADHYLYLPMVGAALAFGWVLMRMPARLAAIIAVALLATLSVQSVAQAGTWRNTSTLFAQALRVNPRSFVAYQNLAVDAYEQGGYRYAAELAHSAIERNPDDSAAYLSRAMALSKLGNIAGAIETYDLGLKHRPDDGSLLTNLAATLAGHGELNRALGLAQHAVELEPENPTARLNLGTILAQSGKLQPAIAQFTAAVDLVPASAAAHADLGFALAAAGRYDEAAEQFRTAVRFEPNNPHIRQGLRQISQVSGATTRASESP